MTTSRTCKYKGTIITLQNIQCIAYKNSQMIRNLLICISALIATVTSCERKMERPGSYKKARAPAEPPKVSENQSDLVSSLRPTVLVLKFFGFNILWDGQHPTKCRLISSLYCFIWLIIHVLAWSFNTNDIHNMAQMEENSRFLLNLIILSAMAAVQIAGTYGSLVMAAWKDGGQLAESLRRIEARMPIRKEVLKKIRIVSITAAATATILVRKTLLGRIGQIIGLMKNRAS